MSKSGYKLGSCLLLSLLLSLLRAGPVAAGEQARMSGGLSRLRVGNTVIKVKNGFIRSLRGDEIFIRLQGLGAQIDLFPWQDAAETGARTLNFIISNVYPPRVKLEGEGVRDFQSTARAVKFQLLVAPRQRRRITLTPVWDEPGFQFVVMGDSRGNPEVFSRLLRQANQHRPLFFVNCGDLVTNGSRKEYYRFLKLIQQAHYPFFFTLGNHDILRQGKRVFNELFGPDYYSFSFAGSQFIFLDNALGRLSDNQYQWLQETLEKSRAAHKFIFLHIPPFMPRPRRRHLMDLPLNRQWFFDLVERHRVDIVFASHFHGYLEGKKGPTRYIISGAAGAPLDEKDGYFHYILVSVGPEGVKTDVVKVP